MAITSPTLFIWVESSSLSPPRVLGRSWNFSKAKRGIFTTT